MDSGSGSAAHPSATGVDILVSVLGFLKVTTTEENKSTNKLITEAVEASVDILKKHIGSVSNLVDNTKEKRSSVQAHRKLTKKDRQIAQHAKLEEERAMKMNPKSTLRSAIKTAAAKVLGTLSGKRKSDETTPAAAATSLPPRQVRKTLDGDKSQDEKNAVPEPRIPRPSNGALIYNPVELRNVWKNLEENIEELSGTTNKNKQRTFMSRYKEALIEKGYVPIKRTAINNFIKKHVENDEPPPLFWNQTGGRDIMSVDDLLAKLHEKGKRVGQGWSYADTKEAVYDAKKAQAEKEGLDIRQINPPDKKTVDAYHSALRSMSNITERTAQSKTQHRDIAETSERAMMSNFSGVLSVVGVIESPTQPIPAQFKFDASRASDGERLSRKIFAKAVSVPEEFVHFIPPALISNTDDMASMYVSPKKQDARSDDRAVLVDISNTTNRSYGIHSSNVNSDPRCNDLKIQLTNSITMGGQYLPVFVQLPGFSESEIPRSKVPNGVVLMEVKGLTPDGNINPFSDQVGHVAFIRGNEKDCEAEVFRHYEQKVRQPSVDKIRQNLQLLDPSHPIARAVITIDGGVPQLIAHMESTGQKVERNEKSFSLTECLLRSMSSTTYRKVSINVDESVNNKTLQGAALYFDNERGSFRASTSAHGTVEKNFQWRYEQDMTQSKNPESTNAFSKKYPFKKPSLHTEGGYHGKFNDLQLCIGIGFDPTKANECLTREEGGLFVWNDATLNRLNQSKVAGDLETKKRILVCCMFELFFHLMLDARIRSDIPLRPSSIHCIVAHK